ncbi:MAG TPA: class I SAM-dependent methyltransferase [Rhizomicrobium sp.]|jgi:ubiquinone/menaquinone biosynthesis C-methylase UbiE|nr:class I SAM-dependent methyltransferase [Rhizomicrobium sp.]
MGFYDRHILPCLLSAAMGTKPVRYQRRKVVPLCEGRVLEVGFGAGHNLPFYDAGKVSHIWALEPSREMRARAAERASECKIPLEYLDLPGEQIPLEDNSADTVLITYTLCTIPDVQAAMAGMRRVLKPNGKMIFCEHGEAPDASTRKWQQRLTPVWKAIGGGCHLARPIPEMIADGGFRIEKMETMYLPGTPHFAGFNYWGSATKA